VRHFAFVSIVATFFRRSSATLAMTPTRPPLLAARVARPTMTYIPSESQTFDRTAGIERAEGMQPTGSDPWRRDARAGAPTQAQLHFGSPHHANRDL
jgi:hypothetical protein